MTAWLLALMLLVAPPSAHEDAALARDRYASIAADLAAVVEGEGRLYAGRRSRERTAAVLLAIAVHESGLRPEVDRGEARGDRGQSVCVMQIRIGRGVTEEGYSIDELALDRRKCFRVGLRLAGRSMRACARSPERERLAAYASGSCARGLVESRAILEMASRWLRAHPMPKSTSPEPLPAGARGATIQEPPEGGHRTTNEAP